MDIISRLIKLMYKLGNFIASTIEKVFLFIAYFVGVGISVVVIFLIGKKTLDLKKAGSTWKDALYNEDYTKMY